MGLLKRAENAFADDAMFGDGFISEGANREYFLVKKDAIVKKWLAVFVTQ